jgi:hypothetical protein
VVCLLLDPSTYPNYILAKSIMSTILFTVRHSNEGTINRKERGQWKDFFFSVIDGTQIKTV